MLFGAIIDQSKTTNFDFPSTKSNNSIKMSFFYFTKQASEDNFAWLILVIILALILALSFAIIALHEQDTCSLRYKVPFVPFLPTLSIVFNATLMTNLQTLTWIRLIIWMIFGFFIYFLYGIHHSSLNPESNRVRKDVKKWGSLDDQTGLTDAMADNTSISSSY